MVDQYRDWGKYGDDRITVKVHGPGDQVQDKASSNQDNASARLMDVLNELGGAGWELVGPPEVESAVYNLSTGKNPQGRNMYNEAASWVQRRFWLKRVVGP